MDTHRRRSSHSSQSAQQANAKSLENTENNLAFEPSRKSTSPNEIYSGVDLARLTTGHQQHQLAIVALSGKQQLTPEIANSEEKLPPQLPQGNFLIQYKITKHSRKHEIFLFLC